MFKNSSDVLKCVTAATVKKQSNYISMRFDRKLYISYEARTLGIFQAKKFEYCTDSCFFEL